MGYEKGQLLFVVRDIPELGLKAGESGRVDEWDPRDSTAYVIFAAVDRGFWVGVSTFPFDAIEPAPAAGPAPRAVEPPAKTKVDQAAYYQSFAGLNRSISPTDSTLISKCEWLTGRCEELTCELGDVKGERDTLRTHVARLERSFDLAMARAGKRR